MGDFYEDDEPIEKILAAFDAGEKGVTQPPGQDWVDDDTLPPAETLARFDTLDPKLTTSPSTWAVPTANIGGRFVYNRTT